MLKNKKLFYQSMLLVIAFTITPLYAPWYDTPRILAAQLYSRIQSLFYSQKPHDTFAELARKSKIAFAKEKLEKTFPEQRSKIPQQLAALKEKIEEKSKLQAFKAELNKIFPQQRSQKLAKISEAEKRTTFKESLSTKLLLNAELIKTLQAIENNNSGTSEQWQQVQNLIEKGADINIATQETGNSALHLALSDPNQELIQKLGVITFLTDHKANDKKENNMGFTPQYIKKQLQRINQPAKPRATQTKVTTPIQPIALASRPNSELLDNELRSTLNALEKEKDQTTWPSYWESILKLINQGANINLQNDNGNTALHLAVAEGNWGKVFTLLGYTTKDENRINTEIKNNDNETAYDIAQKLNNEDILRILPSPIKQLPYSPY